MVSSWRRISPDSLIPHAKASGQYLNNVLAKVESVKAGYQESILLDDQGHVSEGTGENIYIVREGRDRHAGPPQLDPRRHHAPLDHPNRRRTSAIRWWSATSRARRCTWLTRCSCRGRQRSSCPCARSTTTRSARGARARSRACCRRSSTTRSTGAASATASGWTSCTRATWRPRRARAAQRITAG